MVADKLGCHWARGVAWVQLERRPKAHTAVGGANEIDVARITLRRLGIDQVNHAVQRGRFTPAFVAPVTTTIRKHDGEITDRANARTREGGAGIGVSRCVTTDGGLKDIIGVVVREASASFVQPAMYTSPVARSPVIWTLRIKVLCCSRIPGLCHVAPLSAAKVTESAPAPTLKSFHETYIRPKKGEDGLLSAQPDCRSSLLPV